MASATASSTLLPTKKPYAKGPLGRLPEVTIVHEEKEIAIYSIHNILIINKYMIMT